MPVLVIFYEKCDRAILLLKKARAPKVQRESASRTCPYSSSCFTCPMRDCVVEGTEINALVSWEEVAV